MKLPNNQKKLITSNDLEHSIVIVPESSSGHQSVKKTELIRKYHAFLKQQECDQESTLKPVFANCLSRGYQLLEQMWHCLIPLPMTGTTKQKQRFDLIWRKSVNGKMPSIISAQTLEKSLLSNKISENSLRIGILYNESTLKTCLQILTELIHAQKKHSIKIQVFPIYCCQKSRKSSVETKACSDWLLPKLEYHGCSIILFWKNMVNEMTILQQIAIETDQSEGGETIEEILRVYREEQRVERQVMEYIQGEKQSGSHNENSSSHKIWIKTHCEIKEQKHPTDKIGNQSMLPQ